MAKVLVAVHLGRHFYKFGHSDYEVLLAMGHEVHVAANFNDPLDRFEDNRVVKYHVNFDRNPFSFQNIKAYKELKKIIDEEKYDLIHTQSPSGGAVTRLAAKNSRKKGTKVVYTAHGFHFFEGATYKNWLIFFNIEKYLSRYTDCIITINHEDEKNAKNKLLAQTVEYVPGVGIDINRFKYASIEDKMKLREQYNFKLEDNILIYVGELSYRKNQSLLIEAVSKMENKKNVRVLLAGTGVCELEYKQLVNKLNLSEHVIFLGYRKDIDKLMAMSDIVVSTSKQEGLPLNILEAMASELPIIATDCRGNRDLVEDGINGLLVAQENVVQLRDAIELLIHNQDLRIKLSKNNKNKIENYTVSIIQRKMEDLYYRIIV